jgi:alcohol/geraniol dehydrogenase (NADP+)
MVGARVFNLRVNNWQFAFPLPDAIHSEHAGPLMCAGATVFTPILQYGVRSTDRVAVVGVGGLGHLAVPYLAKWGCDVTAVSSSRDKEEHARGLGATRSRRHGGPRPGVIRRLLEGVPRPRRTESSPESLQ